MPANHEFPIASHGGTTSHTHASWESCPLGLEIPATEPADAMDSLGASEGIEKTFASIRKSQVRARYMIRHASVTSLPVKPAGPEPGPPVTVWP